MSSAWGECHHADVPEGQPGVRIRLFISVDQKSDNRIYSFLPRLYSKQKNFLGDEIRLMISVFLEKTKLSCKISVF